MQAICMDDDDFKPTYQGDETTGFQSPAQDYIEQVLDLPLWLDLRKPSYYAVRVKGQALRERGIWHDDILIIDADGVPISGRICVAMRYADPILAILLERDGKWWLQPSKRQPIEISEDIEVWGTVRTLIRVKI